MRDAHVGLYPHEAEARGIPVQTYVQELHAVDRAVLDGEPDGRVTVHVRRDGDRLVGATVVARHADDAGGRAITICRSPISRAENAASQLAR